jgi:hypothetical protein
MPRLSLFLVFCSPLFLVQDDDFYLLTSDIATLATSRQLTVLSLVLILSLRYSLSALCQMIRLFLSLPPKYLSLLPSSLTRPIGYCRPRALLISFFYIFRGADA